MADTAQLPTPNTSGPSAGLGFAMTRSELHEVIFPKRLLCAVLYIQQTTPRLSPGSPWYNESVNNWLRYEVTLPLHVLYTSSWFRVTVDSSVLVVVGSSKKKKRKTRDDSISYMLKHLLDLRREVETARYELVQLFTLKWALR